MEYRGSDCLEVGAAPRAALVLVSGGRWRPRVSGGGVNMALKGKWKPDDWAAAVLR